MSAVASAASVNREQVILAHLPQVKITTAKFHRRCPPEVLLEDLVSAGVVGLLEAYSRFDPGRNLRFKTLAEHRIRGAILDYLRQLDPFPRSIRSFQKQRDTAISRLSERHKRQPLEQEIADELGITLDRYRKFAAIAQTTTISLDARDSQDSYVRDVPDSVTLHPCECAFPMREIEAALRDLSDRERAVIIGIRNGDTHRKIAARLCVSEGRVSQIRRSAIERLRAKLGLRTSGTVTARRIGMERNTAAKRPLAQNVRAAGLRASSAGKGERA